MHCHLILCIAPTTRTRRKITSSGTIVCHAAVRTILQDSKRYTQFSFNTVPPLSEKGTQRTDTLGAERQFILCVKRDLQFAVDFARLDRSVPK